MSSEICGGTQEQSGGFECLPLFVCFCGMKCALFLCFLSAVLFSLSFGDRFTAIPDAQRAHMAFSAYREYRYTIKLNSASSGALYAVYRVKLFSWQRERAGGTHQSRVSVPASLIPWLTVSALLISAYRPQDTQRTRRGCTAQPERKYPRTFPAPPVPVCIRLTCTAENRAAWSWEHGSPPAFNQMIGKTNRNATFFACRFSRFRLRWRYAHSAAGSSLARTRVKT